MLIGSYKRSVSIKRVKDVDVFVRLPDIPSDVTSKEILDRFFAVLHAEFGRDDDGHQRTKRQDRSLQVSFPDYDLHVDAVPARPYWDGATWEIPQKGGDNQWVRTNPESLTSLSTAMNAAHNEFYVPTVKLLRQTRRALLGKKKPGGFFIEVATYQAFASGLVTGSDHAEYYVSALEEVSKIVEDFVTYGVAVNDPTLPGHTISIRATDDELEAVRSRFIAAGADARTRSRRRTKAKQRWGSGSCSAKMETATRSFQCRRVSTTTDRSESLRSPLVNESCRRAPGLSVDNRPVRRVRRLHPSAFRGGLIRAGFIEGDTGWQGVIEHPGGSTEVVISFRARFPFQPPRVVAVDPDSVAWSWHRERDGALCLVAEDDHDDLWWTEAPAFLEHLAAWFEQADAGWPDDRPDLDLERYFRPSEDERLYLYDDLASYFNGSVRFRPSGNNTMRIGSGTRPPKASKHSKDRFGYVADLGDIDVPPRSWQDVAARIAPTWI